MGPRRCLAGPAQHLVLGAGQRAGGPMGWRGRWGAPALAACASWCSGVPWSDIVAEPLRDPRGCSLGSPPACKA